MSKWWCTQAASQRFGETHKGGVLKTTVQVSILSGDWEVQGEDNDSPYEMPYDRGTMSKPWMQNTHCTMQSPKALQGVHVCDSSS